MDHRLVAADPPCSEGLPLVPALLGDTAARDDPAPGVRPRQRPHVGCHASRSMRATICRNRIPVKRLSASCRTKYRACRMRATGLEEPLPETRQRPALDGQRQGVVADREVVGDDPEQQAGLIGPEPVTGSTLAIARRGRFQEAAWYWKLR